MPYVITTRVDVHGDELSVDVQSRRAVATLEEARSTTWHALIDTFGEADRQVSNEATAAWHAITEAGGIIGPLPDGTVIKIESVEWDQLALTADLTYPAIIGGYARREPLGNSAQQIIDAYNAQQSSR